MTALMEFNADGELLEILVQASVEPAILDRVALYLRQISGRCLLGK